MPQKDVLHLPSTSPVSAERLTIITSLLERNIIMADAKVHASRAFFKDITIDPNVCACMHSRNLKVAKSLDHDILGKVADVKGKFTVRK